MVSHVTILLPQVQEDTARQETTPMASLLMEALAAEAPPLPIFTELPAATTDPIALSATLQQPYTRLQQSQTGLRE